MKVIYSLTEYKRYKNPVVAIGVFDGLHRGHRHILKAAVKQARRIDGTSIVLTFYPHPHAKDSIYSLPHRLRLFQECGIDVAIVRRFDRRFAGIEARNFIKRILVEKIGARFVFIGKNFRFGALAKGGVSLLQEASRMYGFTVVAFSVMRYRKKEISSTIIRKLILAGSLKEAEKLLSRPVGVLGKVIRGKGQGRRLGFPTANISPHHEIVPPAGIYCAWVIYRGKRYKGVCYIGCKPTFTASARENRDHRKHTIEVYIFGFHRCIYAQTIEIQFVKKIRQERLFQSPQALKTQIKKDVVTAKKIFSLH